MTARERHSLDGDWQFWTDAGAGLGPDRLESAAARIVKVPAPWQSQAADLRDYIGAAWYRRSFEVPAHWLNGHGDDHESGRVLLGIGAADYAAEVWVNGQPAGGHEGGYLPIELDVTPLLRAGSNEVVVRVDDPPEIFEEVPHGKQSWYGMLSGIWQPVWLESRPATHARRLRITPCGDNVNVDVTLNRPLAEVQSLCLEVFDPGGRLVAQSQVRETPAALVVPEPALWSPEAPNLYTLRVRVQGAGRQDELSDTFGFRTIAVSGGQLQLNGRPLYLRGALDQDYYPDLIATPPSEEYIESQFLKAKAMGLNCLRLHIKVGDPRYYQAADRLGLLVWTELPNWQLLTPAAQERGRDTIAGMVARDWNHPSIIIWTIINESWGVDLSIPEHRAWLADSYDRLKALDPHRLVVGNSACQGNFQVVTDIEDFHNYCAMPDQYLEWRDWVTRFAGRPHWSYAHAYQDGKSWRAFIKRTWKSKPRPHASEVRRRNDEPLVISEFGNWGLPDVQQLVDAEGGQEPWWFETGHGWGDGVVYPHGIQNRFRDYHLRRAFADLGALTAASQQLQAQALKYQIEQMRRHPSLQGYVITEFTDVHWEANGLLDMRRNPKAAATALADVNADDVIVADWKRLAYWSGERCQLRLIVSHFSNRDLAGCRLEWALEDSDLHGELTGLTLEPYTATNLGRISFRVPVVDRPRQARLLLRLMAADGSVAARNTLTLYFFPPESGQGPADVRVYAPTLGRPLRKLGYNVVDKLEEADMALVDVLTDDLRNYLLGGGRVLLLAETKKALKAYIQGLGLKARKNTPLEGNWASGLSWINQDVIFKDLPTNGLVDFMFVDLTPDVVLQGLKPHDYARHVHAGLTVGWLHKTVALAAERTVGRGLLLASTFKLSRNMATNPVAAAMVMDMVGRCVGK